jgi:gluconate 2-dehydrogenase gamma chain
MKPSHSERREFLFALGRTAGAAWMAAHMPAIAAAAQHAHESVKSKQPVAFEVFSAEQAKEVAAIAARIIPTDEDPGATEAGVVYFIDRVLKTFASADLPAYTAGLIHLNKLTTEMFPSVHRFSEATTDQQDKILEELSKDPKLTSRGRRQLPVGKPDDFFTLIWGHTLMGFVSDPEMGGNRDFSGWKVIGRDPAHTFSPPFGEYDKNYPGWQSASAAETEKK